MPWDEDLSDAPALPPRPADTMSSFWHRVFIYNFTPATTSVVVAVSPEMHMNEPRPDPCINPTAHFILALLYFPTCLAFAAFIIYPWTIRPKVESFEIVSASTFPPVEVAISVNCSNPPWCGNVSLLINYTSSSASGGLECPVSANNLYTIAAASTFPDNSSSSVIGPVIVPLCYVGPQIFNTLSAAPFFPVPGVMAEFAGINPGWNASALPNRPTPERLAYGTVTISSVTRSTRGSAILTPLRVITVDSWQVKTALIGQTVTTDTVDGTTTVVPVAQGIQYDGKRPSWRGTCLINLRSFANHRKFTRSSAVTVLEALGTSSYGTLMVLMAFVWIIPVLRLLMPAAELVALKQKSTAGGDQTLEKD